MAFINVAFERGEGRICACCGSKLGVKYRMNFDFCTLFVCNRCVTKRDEIANGVEKIHRESCVLKGGRT